MKITQNLKLYLLLVVTVVSVGISSVAPVYAISDEQKRVISFGYLYDVEESVLTCGGSTSLVGSENAEKIYNYLLAKQLTPVQVSGFMGNMQAESHFDPGIVEKNPPPQAGRGGYGIVQWTNGRRDALEAAAAKKGVSVSDLGFQLDFLWSELEGAYKNSVLTPLKATSDIKEATRIVLYDFEIPAKKESLLASRTQLSIGILTKFGSSSGATTNLSDSATNTCGGGPTNGTVTGDFSLPVDEIYYRQHKEWFTKDHHLSSDGSPDIAADIPVASGTLVYSMTAGKIIEAPNEHGYGRGVTIDAGNGVKFIYGHGTDGGAYPGAKKGDTVKAGQPIMHSGATGRVTGPHLHLEIQDNGVDKCPQTLFVGIVEKKVPSIGSLPASGCSSASAGRI